MTTEEKAGAHTMAEQCKKHVWAGTGFPRRRHCSRNAVKDGYCKQHHPDATRKREEARRTAAAAESKHRTKGFQRRSAEQNFCSGYSTTVLEGTSLGELVDRLSELQEDFCERTCAGSDGHFEECETASTALAPFKGGSDGST